ncbi:MAG TPA: TIGR03118 family protein [Phycisphaerales bacterium]|jgi:uncharacterized protein (TIGR03118 family)|nr:TIGR03118 family protein [Phycisphaerales bacterium]
MLALSVHAVCARTLRAAALPLAAALSLSGSALAQPFFNNELVTNICCDPVARLDQRLSDAWGIAFGAAGPAWVTSHIGGRATLYDGLGTLQALSVAVNSPFSFGTPSGIAANPGPAFQVLDDSLNTGPARFVFATLNGTINGWKPGAPGFPQNTHARIVVDHSGIAGPGRGPAIYTGLALTTGAAGDFVYATDFLGKHVDAFNGTFTPVNAAFVDPNLPATFAPFNVQTFLGSVFVAYAIPDESEFNAAPGAGSGIISIFNLDGTFQRRLITGGALNGPWGMAIAPAGFGTLSGALLVANTGDGRINAFDAQGTLLTTLADANGPLGINGLKGIAFGNGSPNQPTSTLFYTASPTFGAVGIVGRIDPGAIVIPPICHADFNRDGRIAVQDIFDFLNSWFAADLAADFNHSNTLETQDIFDFLNSWLGGCD